MDATTTITQITDDLDGSEDAKTYSLTWQGTAYTIDLGNQNFKALDKLRQPYIDARGAPLRRVATETGRIA